VEFPGPLFWEEKLKRYHQADLFLFPSEHEGFVLVVLEAMAAGLPLLVPRALGFPEAVEDGRNGLLADSGTVDDWVRKSEKLLFDEKVNQAMRKRSRDLAVEKFSWEECAKKNVGVYRQLLG
ncbi:glycosyltransferase family 4 protein, partial [Candidatus Jorgensenbacteria bacterium]|nr:glycosyltransferase family 4 protein [Candidatus Jorgensenbacteria bacterium]